jgi:anti-sigma B factor antagonist
MAEASMVAIERATMGGRPVAVARIECNHVGHRESPIIQTELLSAAEGAGWRIVVDLADVGMLTSMGIGMFVSLHTKCRDGKGKMALHGLRPDIVELLKLTRLDRLFVIVPTREDAMAKACG